MSYAVEPGEIELFVGTSSTELKPAGCILVNGHGPVAATRVATTPVTVT